MIKNESFVKKYIGLLKETIPNIKSSIYTAIFSKNKIKEPTDAIIFGFFIGFFSSCKEITVDENEIKKMFEIYTIQAKGTESLDMLLEQVSFEYCNYFSLFGGSNSVDKEKRLKLGNDDNDNNNNNNNDIGNENNKSIKDNTYVGAQSNLKSNNSGNNNNFSIEEAKKNNKKIIINDDDNNNNNDFNIFNEYANNNNSNNKIINDVLEDNNNDNNNNNNNYNKNQNLNLKDLYAEFEEEDYEEAAQGSELSKKKCLICLEEFSLEDELNYWLDCTCIIHSSCFDQYIASCIKDNLLPIKCPECNKEINSSFVYESLNQSNQGLIPKYEKFTLDYYATNNRTDVNCCPTPGCSYMFFYEEGDARFVCPTCQKDYCLQCKTDWHENISCEENRKLTNVNYLDETFDKFVKGAQYKQCPFCSAWVEKSEGCDYMTCRCKKTFCYNCGEKNPKQHFCPLKKNENVFAFPHVALPNLFGNVGRNRNRKKPVKVKKRVRRRG